MTPVSGSILWLRGSVAGLVVTVGWRGVSRGWRPRSGDRPPGSRDAHVVVERGARPGVDEVRVLIPGEADRRPAVVERVDEWCAAARAGGVVVVWTAVWPDDVAAGRMLDVVLADPKTRWEHVPADRYSDHRAAPEVRPTRAAAS